MGGGYRSHSTVQCIIHNLCWGTNVECASFTLRRNGLRWWLQFTYVFNGLQSLYRYIHCILCYSLSNASKLLSIFRQILHQNQKQLVQSSTTGQVVLTGQCSHLSPLWGRVDPHPLSLNLLRRHSEMQEGPETLQVCYMQYFVEGKTKQSIPLLGLPLFKMTVPIFKPFNQIQPPWRAVKLYYLNRGGGRYKGFRLGNKPLSGCPRPRRREP